MVVFAGIMPPFDDRQINPASAKQISNQNQSLLSDDRLYGTIQLSSIRADGESMMSIAISPNNKTGGVKTLA